MQTVLRSLIAQAFIGGAAVYLCPHGGTKRVIKILNAAILSAMVITPLHSLDYDYLSLAEAKLSSAQVRILQDSSQRGSSLKEQLFRQNCENYIKARAEEQGVRISAVRVELKKSGEESWQPYSVQLEARGNPEAMERICLLIRDELGIPAERQVWSENEY